jgi:hypothetical protein
MNAHRGAQRFLTIGVRRLFVLLAAYIPIVCALGALGPDQALAQAQSAGTAAVQGDNNGEDFTRPQNLFQLRETYSTAPGSGAVPGTTRTVTSAVTTLRADFAIGFAQGWTLAFRNDLPLVAKDPLTADNPTGQYIYGAGDADTQAAIIRQFSARWAAGVGLRLIAPTGSDDLTSGKWQFMPVGGFRYSLPELGAGSYVEGLVRYDVSFAGQQSSRNIGNLQLAPMFNVELPNRWFVTLYPSTDIRINFSDPITGQTGKLFLPLDFMVGRIVTPGVTLSLEIGVPIIKDYPVYDFKTTGRLNVKF